MLGYQNLNDAAELVGILKQHGIDVLVDVRSKPYSRNSAFNKNQLQLALSTAGVSYQWMGRTLGGFFDIHESDIHALAEWQLSKTACLMCMEADPGRCHRDYEIAQRLAKYGVTVHHISA